MTLYRETPCEVCGNKPWQSVYAFRSPGIAHLMPSEDLQKLGDPCPGSGGLREEVILDYKAAGELLAQRFTDTEEKSPPVTTKHLGHWVSDIVHVAIGEDDLLERIERAVSSDSKEQTEKVIKDIDDFRSELTNED